MITEGLPFTTWDPKRFFLYTGERLPPHIRDLLVVDFLAIEIQYKTISLILLNLCQKPYSEPIVLHNFPRNFNPSYLKKKGNPIKLDYIDWVRRVTSRVGLQTYSLISFTDAALRRKPQRGKEAPKGEGSLLVRSTLLFVINTY